jgi:hypothetical protein
MVLLDDEAQVDARFIPFGDSVSRCTICAERTTDSKIILYALDESPR